MLLVSETIQSHKHIDLRYVNSYETILSEVSTKEIKKQNLMLTGPNLKEASSPQKLLKTGNGK